MTGPSTTVGPAVIKQFLPRAVIISPGMGPVTLPVCVFSKWVMYTGCPVPDPQTHYTALPCALAVRNKQMILLQSFPSALLQIWQPNVMRFVLETRAAQEHNLFRWCHDDIRVRGPETLSTELDRAWTLSERSWRHIYTHTLDSSLHKHRHTHSHISNSHCKSLSSNSTTISAWIVGSFGFIVCVPLCICAMN